MSPEMSNNQKNKIGCCRVKVVVGIFCILDIIFFGISIILKLENPLMSCKAAYIDALSSSPDASKGSEKAHIISTQVDAHFHSDGPPAKLEYICTTNFLVAAFAFLHICVDCVTLFAIFKGRHRLIIPFLAIIVFGIIMQTTSCSLPFPPEFARCCIRD
uniref:Uncharacterized protein n=1 Tax=Plectus sambesii TaxID=2011161 RepID=A0A914V9B8_9BILA